MGLVYLDTIKQEAYKPEKKERKLKDALRRRIQQLKDYRKVILVNAYDVSMKARNVEQLWDYCDWVSSPHKYSHKQMRSWNAKNARPMVYAKINSAISLLLDKNPEVELFARRKEFEAKQKLLSHIYHYSWDLGKAHGQLIKFILSMARYGFGVGRRYHRYLKRNVEDIVKYDPEKLQHETQKREIVEFDNVYFETLPIRDCWFDDRSRPYDPYSMRDWCFKKKYDYSTFELEFPQDRFPNAKYVMPSMGEQQSKDENPQMSYDYRSEVELYFYEDKEEDRFMIYDYNNNVLLYEGPLPYDHKQLSCVYGQWSYRNDFTVYGIGIPEILEGHQELLDQIGMMRVNQVIASISPAGFYSGMGNPSDKDLTVESGKLKKLRDADKISWVQVPPPDMASYKEEEVLRSDMQEHSGITLGAGQGPTKKGGKTYGEALMNREEGLQRMKFPLENVEMALEMDAALTIPLIQQIYSIPTDSKIVRTASGKIIDPKLWQEYQQERAANPESAQNKFPEDKDGTVYRNEYRQVRMNVDRNAQNQELTPGATSQFKEVSPDEIRGDFDIKIKAMSTLQVSKELARQQTLQYAQLILPLPYTDIYKWEKMVSKVMDQDPQDWMKDDALIMDQQQKAQQAQQAGVQGAPSATPPQQAPPTPQGQQILNFAPGAKEAMQGTPPGAPTAQ